MSASAAAQPCLEPNPPWARDSHPKETEKQVGFGKSSFSPSPNLVRHWAQYCELAEKFSCLTFEVALEGYSFLELILGSSQVSLAEKRLGQIEMGFFHVRRLSEGSRVLQLLDGNLSLVRQEITNPKEEANVSGLGIQLGRGAQFIKGDGIVTLSVVLHRLAEAPCSFIPWPAQSGWKVGRRLDCT